MINGNLEQFIDTGWFTEATLYLNGFVYWCEAQYDVEKHENHFFVNKWRAINENDLSYHTIITDDGEPLEWECVFETYDSDLDVIKKRFLEARIFEGNTFWQVESVLAWLDEGAPVMESPESK